MFKSLVCLLLALISAGFACGSIGQEIELKKDHAPIEQLKYLDSIGKVYNYEDLKAMLRVANEARAIGIKNNLPSGLVISNNFRASYCLNTGKPDSALIYINRSLQILRESEELTKQLPETFNLLSIYYFRSGQLGYHLLYNDSAYQYALELDLKGVQLTLLFNRSMVMTELGYPLVTDSLLRDLILRTKNEDDEIGLYTSLHHTIATNFISNEQPDSAVKYAQQGLELAREHNFKRSEAVSLLVMGTAQVQLNQALLALESAKKAEQIMREMQYDFGQRRAQFLTAEALFKLGRLTEAKSTIDTLMAYEQKQQHGSNTKIYSENRVFKVASEIYAGLEDFEKSNKLLKRYYENQESRLKEQQSQRLIEAEIKYQAREKSRENTYLKAENELIQQRQVVLSVTLALLILLGIAIVIVLRSQSKLKLARKEYEKETLELELKSQREVAEMKGRELATNALHLSEKNQMLQSLLEVLDDRALDNLNGLKHAIRTRIKRSIASQKELNAFQLAFEQVEPSFLNMLKSKYPNITEGDVRLLSFTKIGLSIKEIASLIHVEPASVKTSRYRLKQRLNLDSDESLESFVRSLTIDNK